ncbi:MAG TPA: hypothetical protein VFV94_09655 [Polyangiaceae bacterium]|nr:hypothetical protein [Polyangiaceae bacterium]
MVPPPSTPPRLRDASANAALDAPLPSFDEPDAAGDEPTRVQSPRSLASTIPPPPRTGTFLRAQSAALRNASSPGSWASAPNWMSSAGESVRRHLPLSIRDRLHEYPGAKVFVVSAAVGLTFFGLFAATGGAVYRALRTPEVTSAGGVATPAETTEAPALSAPAAAPIEPAKAPVKAADEASVLLELADSLLAENRDTDVPSVVARIIARQPELKDDARLKRVLLSAASSGDRKAASDAYALLTGPMGEAGAALLYELSVDRTVREPIRARAQSYTASKDFEKVAALSVYAAAKLRNAKSCEDKHALLDFGASVGGKYVLDYLHELEGQTSCKPDDLVHCQPCLRNDSKLTDAIAKLDRAARL